MVLLPSQEQKIECTLSPVSLSLAILIIIRATNGLHVTLSLVYGIKVFHCIFIRSKPSFNNGVNSGFLSQGEVSLTCLEEILLATCCRYSKLQVHIE